MRELEWNRHSSCRDRTQAAEVAGHGRHVNHRCYHWSTETCLRSKEPRLEPQTHTCAGKERRLTASRIVTRAIKYERNNMQSTVHLWKFAQPPIHTNWHLRSEFWKHHVIRGLRGFFLSALRPVKLHISVLENVTVLCFCSLLLTANWSWYLNLKAYSQQQHKWLCHSDMLVFPFIQMDIFGLFSPRLCFRGERSAGVRTKPPQLPVCTGLMIDRCATFYPISTPLTCCIMTLSLSSSWWPFYPSYRSTWCDIWGPSSLSTCQIMKTLIEFPAVYVNKVNVRPS